LRIFTDTIKINQISTPKILLKGNATCMPDQIVIVNNLKKFYGNVEAVRGISFEIQRGEVFGLLGPNGAGKTTLISMLSTLLKPTAGEATIGGYPLTQHPMAVKRLIGVVPQDLALYPELTAIQNLRFWGQMYGMDSNTLQQRLPEVLTQVGLTERANDRAGTYSGGMKRRLNIAIGLLHKPDLVFMDEPTVGIDPQSRRSILEMVKALRGQGITILYTTHYMEEVEELADRVGIIDHGQLIAIGTQLELTQLVGQQETLQLHLSQEEAEALLPYLEAMPGVQQVSRNQDILVLSVAKATDMLPPVISAASAIDAHIRSIDIIEPNLEAVFLHLTGRALRD
jgi:ABC-2 type transport system ATP-binding protein